MYDENIGDLARSDGKISFSSGGKRLAKMRAKAKDGKIQRVLGMDDTFSEPFKHAILSNYDQVLERIHLESELRGHKKVLQALSANGVGGECKTLHSRLYNAPIGHHNNSILCPIWRHQRSMDSTAALMSRYVFPEKACELYMLTIVFDFAENLFVLEDQILEAQATIKNIVGRMNKKRRGMVMVGVMEPDLRTWSELTRLNGDLKKLLKEVGKSPPRSGGWVLSGHFIVRVPHIGDLRQHLAEAYPSKQWTRVQFDPIYKDKFLAASLMDIIGYAAKYPKPLFNVSSRGLEREIADEEIDRVSDVFYGPTFKYPSSTTQFDIQAAIRQWALFTDRMGVKNMRFSVENVHAQKWFSQSEWNIIRENDYDMLSSGDHRIELLRDRPLDGTGNGRIFSLTGRMRRLRTRRLQYDFEWVGTTNRVTNSTYLPYGMYDWICKS